MTAAFIALFVAVGTLAMLEAGRVVGLRRRRAGLEPGGGSAIEGSVFAILGLLVAFTFSGAASRFEARRALINDETNALGTAWLRLDLLPADRQPAIRNEMRRYLDRRLAAYQNVDDLEEAYAHVAASEAHQVDIWRNAVVACRMDGSPATTTLVLSALNEAFDLAASRLAATTNHPPEVIYGLLVLLSLVCAFLAGSGSATERPSRVHAVGFALVIALVIYVILDLEFPRFGLIRIDRADRLLVDLRATMGDETGP